MDALYLAVYASVSRLITGRDSSFQDIKAANIAPNQWCVYLTSNVSFNSDQKVIIHGIEEVCFMILTKPPFSIFYKLGIDSTFRWNSYSECKSKVYS